MKRIIFSLVGVLMVLAMTLLAVSPPPVRAVEDVVEVQLAMILDGSSSITSSDWTVIINGLADAVENPDCVPQDGSVELTVIQFSKYARVEVGPVVITGANAGDVADDIRDISQIRDLTCISCGICLAADTLAGSDNFDPDIKQALNLVTDGEPNLCSCAEYSCGYIGSFCSDAMAKASAECAREYAISKLEMTDPSDEFDAEGIGEDVDSEWLKDEIVWPEPGYIAPPFAGPGWVRVVEDVEEFAETICEKFKIIINPDIDIDKTADPTTVSEAGTVVTYDYTVTNTGDVTLTGIEVTDDRLGDITVDKTTLAPGESASGTANYEVTQADIDAGDDIVNWATVTCEQEVTDSDDATVEVAEEADIDIEKTADPTTVSEAGTVVTYDYTVTNTGDVTLTGVTVTDDRLGDITLDETTLAPGESASGTANYEVTQADIDAGDDIVNRATVTCEQEVTDSDDATVEVAEEADIDIEKTADPTTVSEAGTVVTYDYTVTNTGDVTLTGIEVTDDRLGDITVDKTTLAPGESASGTANYEVTQADIDAGDDIVNVATVTCEQEVTDEDTATVTITRRPPPSPGGVGCPSRKYLTVDWEGNNTTEPLYSNDKLAVDLLGPSFDLSHNLFLERGTHAPVVFKTTHYVIVVRELKEIPALPENKEAIVVFNITPVDAVFDKDIFLTLGVGELSANVLNVTMVYYDDINGVWVPLEYEAGGPSGVAELTLSAPINHFSIFGVLAELAPTPTQPAHFVASGLNIVPSVEKTTFVTKIGESVTITANMANDGGQEDTYTVVLKLNGETVDTKIVTLGAGRSQSVSFTVSGLDYGQYEVEVAGLSDEFTASRSITWWLIILIIVAIGLIIWGVVWGRRRRRRAEQEG